VSENVKRLVEFIQAHPKCTRRQLFEKIAPAAVVTTQRDVQGAEAPELGPEAGAIISDLHWLIHQGHVIEFANGTLETAKKPLPKPPKGGPAEETKTSEQTATAGEDIVKEMVPLEASVPAKPTENLANSTPFDPAPETSAPLQ
jgi:hypothetical protein